MIQLQSTEIEEFLNKLFPDPIQKKGEAPKFTGSLRNYIKYFELLY